MASIGYPPLRKGLKLEWINVCGASILNSTTLLTAAHCLEGDKMNNLKILVGDSNVNDTSDDKY